MFLSSLKLNTPQNKCNNLLSLQPYLLTLLFFSPKYFHFLQPLAPRPLYILKTSLSFKPPDRKSVV